MTPQQDALAAALAGSKFPHRTTKVDAERILAALAAAGWTLTRSESGLRECSICGDSEPSHVHNGDQRIEGYFTVGRGETDFQAALRWQRIAQARAALAAAPAEERPEVAQGYSPMQPGNTYWRDTPLAQGLRQMAGFPAAAPAAPALDVERLARALEATDKVIVDNDLGIVTTTSDLEEVAAEYARLAGAAREEK